MSHFADQALPCMSLNLGPGAASAVTGVALLAAAGMCTGAGGSVPFRND